MEKPIGNEHNPSDNDISSNDKNIFGGVWTRIKLEALEKYLAAFNTALSKQNFTRIYIDAFAGTGRCDINDNGEKKTIDGSALRALNTIPPFHKFYFIDLDKKKLPALTKLREAHPEKDIEIIRSDANVALKKLCQQYEWRMNVQCYFLTLLEWKLIGRHWR